MWWGQADRGGSSVMYNYVTGNTDFFRSPAFPIWKMGLITALAHRCCQVRPCDGGPKLACVVSLHKHGAVFLYLLCTF